MRHLLLILLLALSAGCSLSPEERQDVGDFNSSMMAANQPLMLVQRGVSGFVYGRQRELVADMLTADAKGVETALNTLEGDEMLAIFDRQHPAHYFAIYRTPPTEPDLGVPIYFVWGSDDVMQRLNKVYVNGIPPSEMQRAGIRDVTQITMELWVDQMKRSLAEAGPGTGVGAGFLRFVGAQ